MAELYRKSSIEKLSNPEQLDRAITVTSPMSWIALLGVVIIIVTTIIWSITGTLPTTQNVKGIIVNPESACAYHADKAGTVTKVLKKAGETVEKGDGLLTIKTSEGKEYTIQANEAGKITDYLVEVDSKIYSGAEIARYTPCDAKEQVVVCYVPLSLAKQLEKGMEVLLYPTSVDTQKYGHMEAYVDSIGDYAVSTSNMWYVLGADNLMAEQFLNEGPVVSVICRIKTDTDSKSGFYWTSENGNDLVISNGTFVSAKIVTDESAPITKLFNNIKEKLEGE